MASETEKSLCVKSAVGDFLHALKDKDGNGFKVSGDLHDALNDRIKRLLEDGAKRAEGNNRITIMGKDL